MPTCENPETHRTFTHIKACAGCRDAWPMIAAVLDEMDPSEIQTATLDDVLARGLNTV